MRNGKIGVGLIGVHPSRGWAMTAHIPALQTSPDFEIVALTNSNLGVANDAALKFNVPHAFQHHEELLAHPDVDLVVVTVKVPYHFELVSAAIQARKAVYCEWPLGNGLHEAIELEQLAEKYNIHTVVGLQSRAMPEVNFIRDLIHDGYVGEVLSASLIGSGIIGGATIPEQFAYTLNPKNGAGMINVAFAHAIDSVSYVLNSRLSEVMATLDTRRKMVQIVETGTMVAMETPDQIAISGKMANGVVISAHFRGGLSRGSNFRLEINGTEGDLIVTSSLGYPGVGETKIQAAQGADAAVRDLDIPQKYVTANAEIGVIATTVSNNYALLASDLKNGTKTAPSFADAVTLHRLIDAVEQSAATGSRQHF
ncbi:Gfo/Idh/MocA family oxidoreductase [Oscillatoria sp. FACHB-1407]|uniref:Gfo/Idh/MocA family protein n=1 Tax=Oscillatoria sp. FACHB-1407 TaxID=2692847 RepID=UPI001689288F|nr:Gfo/Idh/MocA family oxidoreductase [Oscillatoria sp. FACHB-1407]MBD2463498.1 Gfo/Idh/MocA family oxidoreductase [Oscillatoria sp. FACHB-1407]